MRPSLSLPFWLVVVGLASAASIGCATPGPLVSLTPAQSGVVWASGRAVVSSEQTGVRVAAAFDHQDGAKLALRVEVENATEGPLEVTPSRITFNVCTSSQPATCSPASYVFNPEQVLTELARTKSQNEAAADDEQAFLGTMALLSAVGDVATIASGKSSRTTGLRTAASVGLMNDAAARHDSTRASISFQQQLWADVALRRTTLFPGRGIGGRVFLPISLKARRVWLHVMVGGRTFSFPFDQTVTEVEVYPQTTRADPMQ